MTYTYLASPYSDSSSDVRYARYLEAMRCCVHLLERRIWVYSPIVHCHELATLHQLPTDFSFWRDYNEAMLGSASTLMILALPGWQDSDGIKSELDIARSSDLPIRFITPPAYNPKTTQP